MRRLLLAFVCILAARAADLKVGSATAAPGRRATGFLSVPAGSDAAGAVPGNAELDAKSRTIVLAFGLDHIIMQDFRQPSPSVTLTRYGASLGKPSVAVEAGHAGTTHAEDIDALVEGTRSVMRHLKMLA